ncbi:MAG: C4-dicarboxylate TRAP transporter large permease protein DctM [Alphaproteobacteria bacterium MarineAlpha6_Bin3]|nr:MAG: C4-dicarboxylate TRAP transporter large permease protein DctM [Alphaproteobacteria bacterium MarineAlpha6_Bin3]|tara:strand:+ start:8327 stop:9700 length:1374 start_codon:yes stop_codon:yes gene_type:complete
MTPQVLSILMFATTFGFLLFGFPVAFTLAGVAILFAISASFFNFLSSDFLALIPSKIFGTMTNELLVAVPLFVLMGIILEKSKIAEELLETIANLFGNLRGGLGFTVIIVGALLAASTGIVGATVVTMGLLTLPTMIKWGYDKKLASGLICASGTLGQIIPPSIVLILLSDVIQGAYSQSQLMQGKIPTNPVSTIDLFAGALLPGILLVALYCLWQLIIIYIKPHYAPPIINNKSKKYSFMKTLKIILLPIILIFFVLGSILTGIATPTEAASIGAIGSIVLSISKNSFSIKVLRNSVIDTAKISSMIFLILISATIFSLVFIGLEGREIVTSFLNKIPGGSTGAMLFLMILIFFLGFFLDFIQIVFTIIPIVGPIILQMDINPLWFGIMIAINLQTSFLTPPFGFALFYFRGIAPISIKTIEIYKGVIPFVLIQIFTLLLIAIFPQIALWLPSKLY